MEQQIVFYLDDFIFSPSKTKNKKYDVYTLNGIYITSFGSIKSNGIPYPHFFDKIGFYKDYNHYDEKRKINFHKRFKDYKNVFLSPSWFSTNYLW